MNASRFILAQVLVGLALLVAWSIFLLVQSHAFGPDTETTTGVAYVFVSAQIVAGVLFLLTIWRMSQIPSSWFLIALVFATGCIMRMSQVTATPVLEDDFYRYMWDGALTANGISPYVYAPEDILQGVDGIPGNVEALARESGVVLERVNHSWLRTIYPPTAQGAFAVAYWISPFEIQGLRWTWLGIDVIVAGLLLSLLRSSPRPACQFAVYWINPLLVKEVFNSGHMELMLACTLLAVWWAAYRWRPLLAWGCLALAAGAKVWPVLLAPLLWRHGGHGWQTRILGALVFGLILGALALPILLVTQDDASGFAAYAERWQMNDSAFLLIHEACKLVIPTRADAAARGIVALIVLGVLVVRLRGGPPNDEWLVESALAVAATLFLLSPTQFPWYYVWILPLLALRPYWSLLALTATLPVYYLRFPMKMLGHTTMFDYGLIWIEFAPIWIALIIEMRYRHLRAARSIEPVVGE